MSDLNKADANDLKSAEAGGPKNNTDTPDFAFIYFVKKYMALLATISAIPIISTAFGLLQPPSVDQKLPVLTSMACLITFAACFQLRDLISSCVFHRWRMFHLVPFVSVACILCISILVTANYCNKDQRTFEPYRKAVVKDRIDGNPDKPSPVHTVDIAEYIVIQPLFVLALGIILVTSFTQQQNVSVVAMIESQFSDGDRKRLLSRVQDQISFDRLAAQVEKDGCPALRAVGNQIVEQCEAKMHALSQGWIVVPNREARYVMGALFRSFHANPTGPPSPKSPKVREFRFDAVSDRDLNFWAGNEDLPFSEQYFRLNMQAVCDGVKVSRVFLVAEEDLLDTSRRSKLARVLECHQQAGIAWAVAPSHELDLQMCEPEAVNDFALFNHHEMVACFRSHPQTDTKARFIFRTDSEMNRGIIDRQKTQYRYILAQCWMASQNFDEVCAAYEGDHPANAQGTDFDGKSHRRKFNARMAQIFPWSGLDINRSGDQKFLITVENADEVAQKLDLLAELCEASRRWYTNAGLQNHIGDYALTTSELESREPSPTDGVSNYDSSK